MPRNVGTIESFAWPMPAIGLYQPPYNQMGSGAATLLVVGNSGQCSFFPFIVPRDGFTYDRLAIQTTIAQSAGTTVMSLGVYPSLADMSGPDCSAGPTVSGTVALTATAGVLAATVAWAPKAGLYWLASVYVETVAPTTRATTFLISNSSVGWTAAGVSPGTAPARALQTSGATGLPTSQPTIAPVNNTSAIILNARRAT